MKPLINKIENRIAVLDKILEEHGRSYVFDGSRPQALFAEEKQVLSDALAKLEAIHNEWGKSKFKENEYDE